MGKRFYKPPKMVDYRAVCRESAIFIFCKGAETMKYTCDQCGYVYETEQEQMGKIECPECGNCIKSAESDR